MPISRAGFIAMELLERCHNQLSLEGTNRCSEGRMIGAL